jgi:dihydroneopterin aldolase
MSIGTTGLHNLRIDCIIGVYPHERTTPQPLFLDVEVDYDFGPASRSDAIDDALDYDLLARALKDLAVEREFQLLEAFAEAAAGLCLERFGSVEAVRITVRKPNAVAAADASFVKVARVRRPAHADEKRSSE